MRSSYRRIALQLVTTFKPYQHVEFAADMWDARQHYGWGVRVTWVDPTYPSIGPISGIFYHASGQEEAEAIIDAIHVARRT